ncbi:hypothetical protein HGO34_13345 [Agrobacterium vitis]|uniref:Phage tail protein n=1 Tax=Agrobacterium vitis TaxID=373 RepID=A0AAE4WE51_AGRVI|nr:hypothetical protein [Agrobacterium vitis]MCF1499632.1 hypothetical protein [Allorhizobium sp. Av2]MCM2440700.1 hypothetical protein [Agrobacterium vitis]MUZ59321.1 hypothetical protein [Agrobacterium vitis]MVA66552.1 hypothetical protein [Agrobacterium vitis]MVA87413.1 hypothetical protein [Agrobacterium vitis]
MTIYASAGSRLFIGVVKEQKSEDFVRADFSVANAVTWIEIDEIEGLGSVGDTSEDVNFTGMKTARTRTLKGPRSAGKMEVVCGLDGDDAGQQAAIAAEKTIHDYEFRLILNDAHEGGTPSERYFIAKVMSQSEQFDQANNVMKLNISLGVNSNIVRIARSEA